MRIGAKTSRAELAALVCGALEAIGDKPVLVGGAAVSIFSDGRYRSNDLDIVTYRDRRALTELMAGLGFERGALYFSHPRTRLLIQFLSPPAMVGRKYIAPRARARMRTRAGELPILSPLDAACDRLAHYLDGDAQSMEQCVAVVAARRVPLASIRRWLAKEDWPVLDKRAALERLRRLLAAKRARKRGG